MCTLFLLKFKCFPFLCTLFAFNSVKKGVERNKQLWWACSWYKKYTRCWVMFAADHKRLTGWVSLWDELCEFTWRPTIIVSLNTEQDATCRREPGTITATDLTGAWKKGWKYFCFEHFNSVANRRKLPSGEGFSRMIYFTSFLLLPLGSFSLSHTHTRELME